MFTNDEVEWLAQDRCYCIPCERTRYGCPKKKPKDCPLIPDYKDAAEFEARVALRLAKAINGLQNLYPPNEFPKIPYQIILRDCRLKVEEEMQ